jgi:hypothetical protein
MSSSEEIIDRFSGMITKEQAAALSDRGGEHDGVLRNVEDLLVLINKRTDKDTHAVADSNPFTVNVKEKVYRIFNPVTLTQGGVQTSRRSVVLGSENRTLKLNLRSRLSEFIDTEAFERGDVIEVDNAILDPVRGELVEGIGTVMRRVSPAKHDAIVDYDALGNEMRNIDVIGKIVEMSSVRYAGISGKRLAVSDCVLTDLKRSVNASLWGSSALATARIKINDFVKIEFCRTGTGRNGLVLHASDLSRIVANKAFGQRLSVR